MTRARGAWSELARPVGRRGAWRSWTLRGLWGAGLVALAVLYRGELRQALTLVPRVGWRAALLLPLFWVWTMAASQGWRRVLQVLAPEVQAGLWRMSVVRLQAQAVNLLLPLASVPGELLKATLVGAQGPGVWRAGTSVVLDTVVSAVAGLLFTLAGLVLYAGSVGAPWTWAVLGVAALLLLLLLELAPRGAHAMLRRHAVRRRQAMAQALRALSQGGAPLRRALAHCTTWHLLERLLTAVEVWLVAVGMGLPVGPGQAVYATAVMTGASLLFFFVPAQLGAVEGGLSLAFARLGLPPAAGLGVSLVRRGRQLVVALVGLVWLMAVRSPPGAARVSGPPPRPATAARRGRCP